MIYAVVVTFNRVSTLQQVIKAVQIQTLAVDKILVVNNGSTDGTESWLEAAAIEHINQTNLGGAGGFQAGMNAAVEAGAEWIWVMDDDCGPQPNCLEMLMQYSHLSLCINPVHRSIEGKFYGDEVWLDASDCRSIDFRDRSWKAAKKWWPRNTANFEGMLIHRSLIEKIGFPDKRFFVQNDDSLYGWLATKHTTVIVVAAAVVQRLECHRTTESMLRGSVYYPMRNLWICKEYFDKEDPALSRYRARRVTLQFLYKMYQIIRYDKNHKAKRLKFLWLAWSHYKKKISGPLPP